MVLMACRVMSLLFFMTAGPRLTTEEESIQWATSWPDVTRADAGLPGLPSVKHYTLFEGSSELGMFNHGPLVCDYGGAVFISWFSHDKYEGAAGTRVLYCSSTDGETWTEPEVLFDSIGPMTDKGELGTVLSPQWYTVNGRTYAVARLKEITEWIPSGTSISPVLQNIAWITREIHTDGTVGTNQFWLTYNVPAGYEAEDIQPYRFAEDATVRDDLEDLKEWISIHGQNYIIPDAADGTASLCEASYFTRSDGTEVGVYRDNNNCLRLYSSVRNDVTGTWKPAFKTNIPDSSSKTDSGTLPDGTVFIVGNFLHQLWLRDPLLIALSADGVHFDRSYVLRQGASQCREKNPGDFKGVGYQYPNACVSGDTLWVTYSESKEQICVSAIPLSVLAE